MRQSFKVSFYLRSNYENKEGKSPVMLRIFLGGAMSNLGSTKIFVDKSQWNNNTSRQKGRSSEALAVNASLDAISTNLHNIYRKYEDDESISLDKLRAAYLGQAKEYTSFLPVFDKFIDAFVNVWDTLLARIVCRSTASCANTLQTFFSISISVKI